MRRRLPPVNWLRAFEAAARHMSFTGAARELNVTQAAVSQQVKRLEGHLGKPLFDRLPRSLQLTEVGEAFLPTVRDAFERLADGTTEVFGPEGGGPLTVRSAVAFAMLWLAPRLGRFHAAHPGVKLRVTNAIWPIESGWEAVDLEVRHGTGRWPGLNAERLTWDRLFPVCSPALVKGTPGLRTPADLAKLPLLHVIGQQFGWPYWLKAAGLNDVDAGHGPQFDTSAMALEVAAASGGVALGRSSLTEGYFRTGRLVVPFGPEVPIDEAFYLVSPADRAEHPDAALFRAWLMAELAAPPAVASGSDRSRGPLPAQATPTRHHGRVGQVR
ncbi:MAG: transcriptional regulator GcvA [Kiloniellales bacterium]